MSFSLDVHVGDAYCRLAVDRAGARHLLVPVDPDGTIDAQRGSALSLEQRQLIFGGASHAYVDVSCDRSDLYREFDEVVVDIVDAVQESPNARRATLDVVARWRRLFRAAFAHSLSVDARRGLFAELACLHEFVAAEPALSIDCWRGPLREPHDFELASACVEVKAVGELSESIRIHGLEQLETHDEKPLFLTVLTVVEDPEGRSIPELSTELISSARDGSTVAARLIAAGWSDEDPSKDTRYALGPVAAVPVTEDTPRLVSSSFATGGPSAGIGRVEYSIEREVLVPHILTASLSQLAAEVVA